MRIELVPVDSDNYAYLVICEDTKKAAAVDPADAEAVIRMALDLDVEITAIWNTHHHQDHIRGNDELRLGRELQHYAHKLDFSRIPGQTDKLEHGDRFRLGSLDVTALHTPGHTRAAVCYHIGDALITGDTLFGAGCGRLFEGDPPTMFKSLIEVIGALPPETRLYFGHEYTRHNLEFALTVEPGNARLVQRVERVHSQVNAGDPTTPSTLEEELATNPFLRPESEEIKTNLASRFPGKEWTPLQVFTTLRRLRNNW